MQQPEQQTIQPVQPAPIQPAQPVDVQQQQLHYLKQIADHLNFIRSVIIIAAVLSLLGLVAQFCSAAGLL